MALNSVEVSIGKYTRLYETDFRCLPFLFVDKAKTAGKLRFGQTDKPVDLRFKDNSTWVTKEKTEVVFDGLRFVVLGNKQLSISYNFTGPSGRQIYIQLSEIAIENVSVVASTSNDRRRPSIIGLTESESNQLAPELAYLSKPFEFGKKPATLDIDIIFDLISGEIVVRMQVTSDWISDASKILAISHNPFSFVAVEQIQKEEGGGENIAQWRSDDVEGSQWRYPYEQVTAIFPPQTIGEQMERGSRFWGSTGPYIDSKKPIKFRFPAPTEFKFSPQDAMSRRYQPSFGNQLNLFKSAKLDYAVFEMAYPIEITFDSNKLKSGQVSVSEIGSDLDEPVVALPALSFFGLSSKNTSQDEPSQNTKIFFRRLLSNTLANWYTQKSQMAINAELESYEFLRSLHLSQIASFYRRLAQFPLRFEVDGRPAQWNQGLSFKIRNIETEAEKDRSPLPAAESNGETPESIKAFFNNETSPYRAIGLLHTFEFLPELEAVLRNPKSKFGSIGDLKLSALGATGQFEVAFDKGLTSFQVQTANGFVSKIVKTRIGRIAATWNKAKHVVVYERTVAPSTQFAVEQGEIKPIAASTVKKAKWGWPLLRKSQEYVEILQAERVFQEEPQRELNRGRGLHSCLFKTQRVYVNGAWGRTVTEGYEIPLFNCSDRTGFYKRPEIALVTQAGSDAENIDPNRNCLSEQVVKMPEHFYFYSSTKESADYDTDKWEAVVNIDSSNALRVPPLLQLLTSSGIKIDNIIQPQVSNEFLSNPRFAIAVEAFGPMDLNHDTVASSSQLLVKPKFISIDRSSHSAIPANEMVQSIDGDSGPSIKDLILGRTPDDRDQQAKSELNAAAELRSVTSLLEFLPKEIERIAASYFENLGTEMPEEFLNRAKASLNSKITSFENEAKVRLGHWKTQLPSAKSLLTEKLISEPMAAIRNELSQFQKIAVKSVDELFSTVREAKIEIQSIKDGLIAPPVPQTLTELKGRLHTTLKDFLLQEYFYERQAFILRLRSTLQSLELKNGGTLGLASTLSFIADAKKTLNEVNTKLIAAIADGGLDNAAARKVKDDVAKTLAELMKTLSETNKMLADVQNLPSWLERLKPVLGQTINSLSGKLERFSKQVSLLDPASIAQFKGDAQKIVESIRDKSVTLLDQAGQLITTCDTLPQIVFNETQKIFSEQLQTIDKDVFKPIWETLASNSFKYANTGAASVLELVESALENVGYKVLTAIVNSVLSALEKVETYEVALRALPTTIKDEIVKIEQTPLSTITLPNLETEIATLIRTTAQDAITEAETYLARICNEAREQVNRLDPIDLASLPNKLYDIVESVKKDIEANLETIKSGIENNVVRYYDDVVREKIAGAQKAVEEAGEVWDKYKPKADSALKLIEIFSNPPSLPQIDFNAVDFNCAFSDIEKQLLTSPCVAKIRQAEAALSELGLDVPVQNFLHSLTPNIGDDSKLNAIYKSICCDFEDLFKKFRIPKFPDGAIKIKHGFDGKTREAWVNVKVDHEFKSVEELFGIGPLSFAVNRPQIKVDSNLRTGLNQQTSTSLISLRADWIMQLGGQDMVTLEDVALKSVNGSGIEFELDPSKIRPHPSLAFLLNIFKDLEAAVPPWLEILKDSRGAPIGMLATYKQAFPGFETGVVSIGDFTLDSGFGVKLESGQMAVSGHFGMGAREAPIFLTIAPAYSGGGWITSKVAYRNQKITYEASIGVAFGSSKTFNIAGIAKGKYAVYAFVEANFNESATYFSAGVSMNGSAKIIGYLNANVSLLLAIEGGSQSAGTGRGQIDIEIEVSWFYTAKFHRAVTQQL